MKTNTIAPNYKGFRFPSEIISHAVWLYFRFSLSFRDVEELLAQRGIVVTYETVRQWYLKFGQSYANELCRRRPRYGDKWHMDEVVLTIRGEKHYLWRAVDQEGNVLDIRHHPECCVPMKGGEASRDEHMPICQEDPRERKIQWRQTPENLNNRASRMFVTQDGLQTPFPSTPADLAWLLVSRSRLQSRL